MRLIALCVLAVLLLGAGCRLLTAHEGFADQDREQISGSASRHHLAGTDELGRDRALRMSVALFLGLAAAFAASAVASGAAWCLGGLSAFGPDWASRGLLYASDLFLTLPWLFLLMLVRSAMPLNLAPLHAELVTFALLGVLGIPAFLRINHERVRQLLLSEWFLQTRASGLRRAQLVSQLWPHLRPMVWTQCLVYVPACLIAEANLGTLGLGTTEPLPSFGSFLANLQSEALLSTSHLVLLPVLVLVLLLAALELTLMGEH